MFGLWNLCELQNLGRSLEWASEELQGEELSTAFWDFGVLPTRIPEFPHQTGPECDWEDDGIANSVHLFESSTLVIVELVVSILCFVEEVKPV